MLDIQGAYSQTTPIPPATGLPHYKRGKKGARLTIFMSRRGNNLKSTAEDVAREARFEITIFLHVGPHATSAQ